MDVREDYIHFLIENKDIFNLIKDEKSLVYDLIEPITKVLDYFNEVDMEVEGEDKEDIFDIFEIGFNYIYDVITSIRYMADEHFDGDINELIKFDSNLYYYLRVDEIDSILEGENELISSLRDQLESTLTYQKELTQEVIDMIEDEILKALDDPDKSTTPDTFMDIADELGLELI